MVLVAAAVNPSVEEATDSVTTPSKDVLIRSSVPFLNGNE